MPFSGLSDLKTFDIMPGWLGRFLHAEKTTTAYWEITAGAAPVPEHDHAQEEIWHVLEGELEVTIAGETQRAGPGAIAIVPPHTPHSVRVLSDARAIVVDSPCRDELAGVDIR